MPYFTTSDNIEIFYEIRGKGNEDIMFLHGLGSSSLEWKYQLGLFSQNYRCIIVDLRGHGKSGLSHELNVNAATKDIIELIKELKIKPHIVGISIGGMAALKIAIDCPECANKLVIVNSLPEIMLTNFRQKWLFFSRIFLIKFFGMKVFAKTLSKKLFPFEDQELLRKKLYKIYSATNPKVYLKFLKSSRRWTIAKHLKNISNPTLFIISEFDHTSYEIKKFYAEKIPNVEIKMMNGLRHIVNMEAPREFNHEVVKFLAK